VAHRHHEVLSDEDVDLAELDGLGLVHVAGGAQDDEERSVVALDLGPLVRLDGVLDGQRVQPELRGHGGELLLGGRVQPDPRQPALPANRLVRFVEGGRLGGPAPVHVDGVVHDHGPIIRRRGGAGQEPEERSTTATTAARAKR
jgi:hypothetical protein